MMSAIFWGISRGKILITLGLAAIDRGLCPQNIDSRQVTGKIFQDKDLGAMRPRLVLMGIDVTTLRIPRVARTIRLSAN